MKLPETIKIGFQIWRIEIDDLSREDDRRGVTFKEKQLIKLDPTLPEESKKITLWHEIKHAIAEFLGIDGDRKYDEEEWITRMSGMEITVLDENKELREFLWGSGEEKNLEQN